MYRLVYIVFQVQPKFFTRTQIFAGKFHSDCTQYTQHWDYCFVRLDTNSE
uniref:Uncharacterized protein n=1 Tax=Arundo donax TaxID=35708 RepID=A0A0A9G3W4_ARUDO